MSNSVSSTNLTSLYGSSGNAVSVAVSNVAPVDNTVASKNLTTLYSAQGQPTIIPSAGGGGSANISILDEGILITSNVASMDFVGNAVVATAVGNVVTININDSGNANYAAYAGNVTINAQPNITSVGNLVYLNVRDDSNTSSVIRQFTPNSVIINTGTLPNVSVDTTTTFWPNASTAYPARFVIRSRGNSTTPTTAVSGDRIYQDRFMVYNGNTNVLVGSETWTLTAGGTLDSNANQAFAGGQINWFTGNPAGGNLANSNSLATQNQLIFTNSGSFQINPGTVANSSLSQASTPLLITNYGLTTTQLDQVGGVNQQKARGNRDGLLSVQPGDLVGRQNMWGYNGTIYQSSRPASMFAQVDSAYVANASTIPLNMIIRTVNSSNASVDTTFFGNTLTRLPGNINFSGSTANLFTANTGQIALGISAGLTSQGINGIAIGPRAGNTSQGQYGIAIGDNAGSNTQGQYGIAIGANAGSVLQNEYSIAIGLLAGNGNQGANSIAIGTSAGLTSQANNSIILNATGSTLDQSTANTFTVKPVRNANTANAMYYNNTTGEITYDVISAGTSISNGTSNVNIATSGGNVTTSVGGTANVLVITTTGANITGTLNATGNANVGNIGANAGVFTTVAGSLTTAAQPNITSVGSLTGLTVSNATGIVDFTTTANVTLGAVANLHISGGTNGYVLSTDGANTLSWIAQSGGGGASISNGTSNVNIATVNGNVTVGVAGNANVATFTGTTAIVGNLKVNSSNISLGFDAGAGQGGNSIAIGNSAGVFFQPDKAIAIGYFAGADNQGLQAIAIGPGAGNTTQGNYTVAIGPSAGKTSQGIDSVGIGRLAGETSQGYSSVAVGAEAGKASQGANSVAIGGYAGYTNQANNSIILNATGSALNQSTANTFTVKPVRAATTANILYYDTTGGEITYGVISAGASISNGTSNVNIDTVNGNVTTSVGGTGNVVVITTTGANISGYANITGNANVGNIGANIGVFTTGNITTGNVANLFLTQFQETVAAGVNTSTSISPNVAASTIFNFTANNNFTFNGLTSAVAGSSATVIITQDGTGSRLMTSTMLFVGGSKTLSTAASAKDIVSVFYDGTTYFASLTKGYA